MGTQTFSVLNTLKHRRKVKTMIQKNVKKENAKKYRVFFEGRLCTVEHKSRKHPERADVKREFRRQIKES